MASSMGDPDNTQLVRQCEFLSVNECVKIQRLILEEIQEKSDFTSLDSIYCAVRQRFCNFKDRLHLDSIKNRIVEMIKTTLKTLPLEQKPTFGYNNNYGCEAAKSKGRKGEKSKNKFDEKDQLVAYDLALHEEERKRDEQEMEEGILRSKIHLDEQMEFEKKLQETLAKSYQEEKLKLLTMLTAEDFDFDHLADQLNKVLPDETAVTYKGKSFIHISALILAIIELFDHDYTIINAKPIQNHIRTFGLRCLSSGLNVPYQERIHQKNVRSTFNVCSINDYLVNVEVRGDGNCMWSSISHTLVGDYTMMESLRLLTAYSLMQYSEKFSEILTRQTSEFSYNALTFEQLVKVSVSLQSWGDEFHLIALSLALKRPIYSYGSLVDIPESAFMGYEQFRQDYELESFSNHFKFIGDANDANNEPILLHYDGYSHYSSVLKRSNSVKPLVPFTQIFDTLFNVSGMAMPCNLVKHSSNGDKSETIEYYLPDKPEKLIDIDMTEMVSSADGERGNKSDYITDDDDEDGRNNEIKKLNRNLREKDILLRQYESFFQEVKTMLDNQKFDLRQLQGFVEKMEISRK